MRINVYEEELGEGVEIIRKDNVNGNETFYGLRVWLKSPKEIIDHSTPEDDDRCAITFWYRDKISIEHLAAEMAVAYGHGTHTLNSFVVRIREIWKAQGRNP